METPGRKRKTRGGGGSGQVGFRFHPTGEELVDHYLKLKKQDKDFQAENIPEVDVCNFDPGDLAARMPSDDMEWYFFGRKNYKYKNSKRSNRTTPGGYWKITGKERDIKVRRSKAVIGKKRTLTFYRRCEPKPKKTNWVMHEHDRIDSEANPKLPQDFVICRMKKKSDEEDTSIGEVELGSCSVSNVEDHAAAVVTPGSQDNSSSTPLSSGYIELEDVLQANGTNDDCNAIQSPFGDNNYSYINKNDISTCDEGEPHSFTVSDLKNEAPHNMSQQSQNDMDSLCLHVAQESPTCVISKNNVSTSDDDEQFKNSISNFENQATNKRISEVCPPPEEDMEFLFDLPFFFDLPQLEDYTL
ncbi:NAC domain-containing protein 71-like isoform X2 [Malus domestica]|uniref:NAC domain-containing protein 71-like isoform X2 n=1 Tax=Malus domestica TaxID=3750 RepID=UPI0039768183